MFALIAVFLLLSLNTIHCRFYIKVYFHRCRIVADRSTSPIQFERLYLSSFSDGSSDGSRQKTPFTPLLASAAVAVPDRGPQKSR